MRERAVPPDDITPEEFFTRWVPAAVVGDPERRRRLGEGDALLQFELDGDGGGCFALRIAAGEVTGASGPVERPDLRIELDVETWRALNRGELSAALAFLQRRVRLHGNLFLAVKLHLILG
jgi:putative sterol carrier protein